jgi:hypothetical protein
MKITPDKTPVNSAAAKALSRQSVPTHTVADALEIMAANITGDISRIKIAETLNKGLIAKYTLQIRKCQNSYGCNVTLTFQAVNKGTTVAHFTELA